MPEVFDFDAELAEETQEPLQVRVAGEIVSFRVPMPIGPTIRLAELGLADSPSLSDGEQRELAELQRTAAERSLTADEQALVDTLTAKGAAAQKALMESLVALRDYLLSMVEESSHAAMRRAIDRLTMPQLQTLARRVQEKATGRPTQRSSDSPRSSGDGGPSSMDESPSPAVQAS